MGVQSMVKHAVSNIMMKNSSNTRTGRLLIDRATDIAQDIEHSGDPASEENIQRILTDVAAEFEGDDIQSQTDPVTFLKRQKAIIQADAQLDVIKARSPGRDSVMKEAAKKDIQNLGLNLRDLCQSSLPLIKELCDMLPNRKTLKTAGVSEEILAGNEHLSRLQIAMAQFNLKISALQELGYVDSKIMIVILRLEDPDADPLHLHCGVEETFGELLQKAFLPDPEALGASDADSADGADDDPIPDVWVRRFDEARNSVTKTSQWWEHQPESMKIRDVFSSPGERSEGEQKQWTVEVVEKAGDYVVVLVNDNGVETGKVVDLPNSNRRRQCTTEHIRNFFPLRKVVKVLELQGGKDASQKVFNKLHYQSKTNPLYIELDTV